MADYKVSIGDIRQAPDNVRAVMPEQSADLKKRISQVAAEIAQESVAQAIPVRDGVILGGHARLKAMLEVNGTAPAMDIVTRERFHIGKGGEDGGLVRVEVGTGAKKQPKPR